ncbi:DHA2 family efflux MFS transporter permease subunit [Streptomyces avicenniae]|uniref:DHA2 family efflux MFS transporter permease subunit n=1 Tax=Streptomyces avicenniae TaxID=500153 RepID=UPI00069CA3BF|nr:DHA2 family efflux MFS transporter permease subunit [Streptomyces avicenniae]
MTRAASPAATAAVVVLGSMMTVLDVTVVNVALARLADEFDASLATLQWVATGYTLALAAVIPLTAWAIARVGTRRLYLLSIGLFTLGSALAGLAWSTESLILFRVLQGLGGGMVMPVGMTIVVRASTPETLGRMMSIMGLPVLIGPLAGPTLGGWLVDDVSWRWIFFVNVPIGALALLAAGRLFPRENPSGGVRLDVPGLLALSPGLALLLYGLATGGERGDFTAPGTLLPTAAGVLLVGAFTARALTARHPLLDLRILRRRTTGAGVATLALFTTAYFGSMLLLPLFLQLARGESATSAGLLGIPQALATGLTLQVVGRLYGRVAAGRLVLFGLSAAGLGFAAFVTQVGADTPYWRLLTPLVVMGIGVGSTMMPIMTAVSRGVPQGEVPVVSTILGIAPQIGSSIGAALVSVVLAGNIENALPRDTGTLGAVQAAGPAVRDALAPALADAFRHTYVWPALLIVLALLPALFLPRARPRPDAPAPAERPAPVETPV